MHTNKVFVDGKEVFGVTVTIVNGKATVTHGDGPHTNSGGGPGEEQNPPKTP